ncbi:MAG: hypothetical protein IT329_13065 [Caldilineaceae bacterium]|nr:hypothetical protein [Caldilineaceae bacterium]
MDRTTPVAHSEEIELYIRTYYSLLRSSGPVRVRSLEETHAAMKSSLHQQADSPEIDVSALVYCALRLPECIAETKLMVMGQMEAVFRRSGYDVEQWQTVRAKARRRKFYFDPDQGILAAFVASVSDIDDLIPCVTTLQIEWNKIHQKLGANELGRRLQTAANGDGYLPMDVLEEVRDALGLSSADFARLGQIWPGSLLSRNLQRAARSGLDLRILVLGSGLSDYRRSVQLWWRQIEEEAAALHLNERPIYFISSNVHSLINLVSGHAWELQEDLLEFVRRENPENLLAEYEKLAEDDVGSLANFLYYVARIYGGNANRIEQRAESIAEREKRVGLVRVSDPHYLDVEAQLVEINSLQRQWLDPRLRIFDDEEWGLLQQSDALLFNIDYPLGMAAYHIFSQVSTALDRILGVYILGKAATLNGRVGDVMLPNVVYDEHSRNSYLFRNCFTAQDVAPFLVYGTVFDNQKAVTVRGTILQNRNFMHVFYEEGYTDIEMEAGPYLSGIYEDIYPKRHPDNEIVNLFINAPYDIGLIHYASDTPISRRQTLLSKSLSYFGVDATYAASIAVLRRVLKQEAVRQRKLQRREERQNMPLVFDADGV